MRLFGEGRFDELDRIHHEELKQREGLPQRDNQGLAIRQFMMLSMRGQAATAIPGLEGYAERYPLPVAWQCGLVSTYANAGRFDDARRELERLSANEFAAVPDDHNWIYSHMMLGGACFKLREKKHAVVLAKKLAPFSGRMAVVGIGGPCGGVVDGTLAELAHTLGERERAEKLYATARELNLRLGARLWAAYV
jgi:hypothetical protein